MIARDYWVNGHSIPVLDTAQDHIVKDNEITATFYKIKYSRKVSTGDNAKDKILTTSS